MLAACTAQQPKCTRIDLVVTRVDTPWPQHLASCGVLSPALFKNKLIQVTLSNKEQRKRTKRANAAASCPNSVSTAARTHSDNMFCHTQTKRVYLTRSAAPSELLKHSWAVPLKMYPDQRSANTRRCLGKVSSTLLDAARATAPPTATSTSTSRPDVRVCLRGAMATNDCVHTDLMCGVKYSSCE